MRPTSVDECLDHIPNHFDLCAVAAKRARQLARGATSRLPFEGHKATVQSLIEIASGEVGLAILVESDPPLPDTENPFLNFDFPNPSDPSAN